MIATQCPTEQRLPDQVRLVYHYRDGHDFVTETMLRSDAIAYMPVLLATEVDDDHYEATFATIELLRVPAGSTDHRRDGLERLAARPAVPWRPRAA